MQKISCIGQENIDFFNGLFNIGKPGPDFIFHRPRLLFFQSVVLGRGFLWRYVLGDLSIFLIVAPAQTLN